MDSREEPARRLDHLRRESAARRDRAEVAKRLAPLLDCAVEEILFCDHGTTEAARSSLERAIRLVPEAEFPDLGHALAPVESTFLGSETPVLWMHPHSESCGAVEIAAGRLVARLRPILAVHSSLIFVSADGTSGVCLLSEEGLAPRFPRFLQIWTASALDRQTH